MDDGKPAAWGVRVVVAAVLLALLVCALPAVAGTIGQERLIHRFDFEERELGNYEELPINWYIVGRPARGAPPNFERMPVHAELMKRPGFPLHSVVRFDQRHATSGTHSLYLGVNGGSASAYLAVGAVPVVPKSDYLINARVRTSRLAHARARMVAYLVNDKGEKLDATIAGSELVTTDGEWETLSVRVFGESGQAAWLGVEVALLQPNEAPDSPLGKHQIVYQEVDGGAWFDDISVWQIPTVSMRTQSDVNIIRVPDRPRLSINVRDLTGRPVVAELSVYDHRMRLIDATRQPMGDGAPAGWNWTPQLPRYGWYLADLRVREADDPHPIAHNLGAFLWLGDEPALHDADARRFVLVGESLSNPELALMPGLLDKARLESAMLSAWNRRLRAETIDEHQSLLDQVLQAIQIRGREVGLSLAPAPDALVKTMEIDTLSPLPMFLRPASTWSPYLSPVLLRHGQGVRQWQIGTTLQPDAFFTADLPTLVARANREFHSLAPQPELVIPWRLDQPRRPDINGVRYAMAVPLAIQPRYLPEHLSEWQGQEVRLDLRVPPATHMTHQRRLDDMTQRMVYSWRSGEFDLAARNAWTVSEDRHITLLPDPILGAFTSVARRLAGRRFAGDLSLAEGLVCMIFDGPAGGMLVAWNRSADADSANIDMFLGPAPIAIDAFGNRSPIPLVNGYHKLPLTDSPIFIEGIDPALALFRASFTIDPPELESTQTIHQRTATIRNPWRRTISGYMTMTDPENWRIEPRRSFFSIAAGDSTTIPVSISFPISEVAGLKRVVARFDFVADQHYTVDLNAALTLRLKDVDFDANLTLEPNKDGTTDAVVSMLITSRADHPLSLHAFATMPGFPRQERLVPQLKPGQSVVRRFRFTDAGDAARHVNIRAGLRESGGPAVLNKIVSHPLD